MNFLIVFLMLFALVLAAPSSNVQILKSESDVQPLHYTFAVETSDGTSHQGEGNAVDIGRDYPAIVVKGSYSWTDEDGKVYTVDYVADENGYHPSGAHLPELPKLAL